jgi:hypothetical protein
VLDEARPALTSRAKNPIGTVAPGASPYVFTASEDGVLYLSGGTVSIVSFKRFGNSLSLGLLAGSYPMRRGDGLTITYVVAPTLNWVPS